MKATLNGQIVAESDDIVDLGGYAYFPEGAVRCDWLRKAPKTADDLDCPHGVQFYDVVLNGTRYGRAAWQYEAPRPEIKQVARRFGFWGDIQVG